MDIYEQIKDKVSVRDLLEAYGVYPFRGNNIYRCCFHTPDKNPSAHITRDGKRFKCFACGRGGDIFDLVELFEECNRKDALKIIDNKFGLGLYKQLSQKEKLELARKQRERERKKKELEFWENFEEKIIKLIMTKIKDFQKVKAFICNDKLLNEFTDLYYNLDKQQKRLVWLYNFLCGFDQDLCEYDLIYGSDKQKILISIRNGEFIV